MADKTDHEKQSNVNGGVRPDRWTRVPPLRPALCFKGSDTRSTPYKNWKNIRRLEAVRVLKRPTVSHTCDQDKEDEFQATEWTDVESKDTRPMDGFGQNIGQNWTKFYFRIGTVKTRIVHGHQKTNSQGQFTCYLDCKRMLGCDW